MRMMRAKVGQDLPISHVPQIEAPKGPGKQDQPHHSIHPSPEQHRGELTELCLFHGKN